MSDETYVAAGEADANARIAASATTAADDAQKAAVTAEAVAKPKGKLSATGSTATAYCWIVWLKKDAGPTHFRWIAPCRKDLERPGDYPE